MNQSYSYISLGKFGYIKLPSEPLLIDNLLLEDKMQAPETSQNHPICPGAPRKSKKRSSPKYSPDSKAKRRLFDEFEMRQSKRARVSTQYYKP